MKNYYEILGVDEDSTQMEIRARWAELTKLCHPDVLQSPEVGDRIKDINEAYQVLKDHSTRLEYDLEWALRRSILKKAEERKRKRLRWQKILSSVGLAAILIGIGSFLFFSKSPQVAQGPIKVKVSETAEVIGREAPKTLEKPDKIKESQKATELEKPKKPIEVAKVVPREPVKVVVPEPVRVVEPKKREKVEKAEKPKKPEKPVEVARVVPREPVKVVVPEPVRVVEPKKPEKPKEPEKPVEVAKVVPREPAKVVVPEPVRVVEPKKPEKPEKAEKPKEPEKPAEVAKVVPREPAKVVVPELARLVEPEKRQEPEKPAPSREEEVNKFFSGYIAKYNYKDVEGFLSFFSSRAIQNQKYGMDSIKKIYANFFDQSQELQYQIRNMQVEPNPNGLEVKARYELNQVLKAGGEKKVWRGQIRWILVREGGGFKIISLDYQHQK